MKRTIRSRLLRVGLMLAVACLLLPEVPTRAQSGGGYELTWSSIDGGGVMWSTGGAYTLGGTAGQPDAGWMTGADYALAGGFWSGSLLRQQVYLPLVLRDY